MNVRLPLSLRLDAARSRFAERLDLALENVALRHQMDVLERSPGCRGGRTFRPHDRLLWVLLARWWPRRREALKLVQPQTVRRWQRVPWWRHALPRRRQRGGRPRIAVELQDLIRRMQRENPRWGSRRILGELKKLGFEVSDSTVRRYRGPVRTRRRGQSWSTFFSNHAPYVRHALREAVDDRTRRLLETLQRLAGRAPARSAGARISDWSEVADVARSMPLSTCGDNSWLCHELIGRARDGPDDQVEAA